MASTSSIVGCRRVITPSVSMCCQCGAGGGTREGSCRVRAWNCEQSAADPPGRAPLMGSEDRLTPVCCFSRVERDANNTPPPTCHLDQCERDRNAPPAALTPARRSARSSGLPPSPAAKNARPLLDLDRPDRLDPGPVRDRTRGTAQ